MFTQTEFWNHFISDQNLEETRNKIGLFTTTTTRTATGQSNLIGTRAEERLIVIFKKMQQK
jgi:hypothetical protein